MSDVHDDDVYSIDELTEHEITKIEEKKNSQGKTRYIYLSPSKKENSRKTNIRPVYRPGNEFGQDRPMYKVALHERLDNLIPGTRRRLFPNLAPGLERVRCLNDSETETYCHVCPEIPELRRKNYDIRDQANSTGLQKDQALHRTMRSYFSGIKRTEFHFFIAVRRLGRVSEGQEWDKGKMPVKVDDEAKSEKNPAGLVRCSQEEAQMWADPIGIVKIKDWWIEPILTELNRRKMSHQKYEEGKDRKISETEWLRECPKERPKGPFHPDQGYCVEVVVSGKGKDQEWKCNLDPIEGLKNSDKAAIIAAYPNLMHEINAIGEDEVVPYKEWSEKNPKGSKADYTHYRKRFLSAKMAEALGIGKPESGVDAADEIEEPETEGEGDGDGEAYSMEGGGDGLDDIEIPDIPF